MEVGLLGIGAGLAIGLAALATGYAQARIGSAGIGALAEKPELTGRVILLLALPETLVILGFAVAAMIILLLGGWCPSRRSLLRSPPRQTPRCSESRMKRRAGASPS